MTDETCLAMTNSGNRCQRKPIENGYCSIPSHQAQAEEPEETQKQEAICGHENVHAQYDDVEHLRCELPDGHSGNHAAKVYEVSYGRGGVTGEGKKVVEWSDMAGIPVDEIEPGFGKEEIELGKAEERRQKFIQEMMEA